jgi:hypothetical protein
MSETEQLKKKLNKQEYIIDEYRKCLICVKSLSNNNKNKKTVIDMIDNCLNFFE